MLMISVTVAFVVKCEDSSSSLEAKNADFRRRG